jgi:hypothetical protein
MNSKATRPDVTPPTNHGAWWARAMVVTNIVLAFATIALVYVGYGQGVTALNALNAETHRLAKAEADRKVYDWQKFMVYKIIADGLAKERPLDFDEIKKDYEDAAVMQNQKVQDAKSDEDIGPRLKSKDIQPDTLRKILMDLHTDRVIFVMYPGPKYMMEEAAFNPVGLRAITVSSAELYAVDMLITESNKYTIDQLATKIAGQYHLGAMDCRAGVVVGRSGERGRAAGLSGCLRTCGPTGSGDPRCFGTGCGRRRRRTETTLSRWPS